MHYSIAKHLYSILFIFSLSLLVPTANAIETGTPDSVYRFQLTMANRGNAQSQYNLAMMHETGMAVDKDMSQAREWYIKSASQDYKPARDRLIYLDIKLNNNKAKHADWLKQIKQDADIGDAEAVFLVGQMYAEGTGFSKDLIQAERYLRKAIASDIAGSERALAKVETEINLKKR